MTHQKHVPHRGKVAKSVKAKVTKGLHDREVLFGGKHTNEASSECSTGGKASWRCRVGYF
jgi:hypothetical protein